jgi:aminoglycoside 6'-N-acetyltransferase I
MGLEKMFRIIHATKKDEQAWLKLRKQLWPRCVDERHLLEIKDYISSESKCAFLAVHNDGSFIGFCECALRHDYVEGSTTSPTAYLEGIFVTEQFRKLGIAKKLIEHVETWSKHHGCQEIGSDTEIDNQASIDMHAQLGFAEKNRVVHFIRSIR